MIRPAEFSDWKLLLDWRNDPQTRQNSISSAEILEENHKQWLQITLESDVRKIFIYELENPVGTIRLDIINGEKILSWTVAPDVRGKGIGSEMLKQFVEQYPGEYFAEILPENKASLVMAGKVGFKVIDSKEKPFWKAPNTLLTYYSGVTDLQIIDAIQQVRNKNNVNWMDILRIAFKYAPEETREVFKKITDSDDEIGKLSRKLANNG